jgi:hypothetical protein
MLKVLFCEPSQFPRGDSIIRPVRFIGLYKLESFDSYSTIVNMVFVSEGVVPAVALVIIFT